MANKPQFDLILLGATGYTGKLTAEYITSNLPTSIKWAIVGRSESKLQSLLTELKDLNSTRSPPEVITTNLSPPELTTLAKKTKIILNTVGPYHLYSTPVVQACAEAGTHYLDVTGETPWVREMILNHEETAKKSGAIIIPEIGLESAPSDLVAYAATSLIRQVWDCGVMDIVSSIHEMKMSGASGGTLASGLGLADHYSMKELNTALNDPFSLSPSHLRPYTKDNIYPRSPEPNTYARTALQKFTGVWEYPRLGLLATSITAKPNVAVVHRSASLNPYFYGFNFTYEEYMSVSSSMVGVLVHFIVTGLTLLLAVPPFRALLKAMAPYKPGTGPTKESTKNDAIEFRAIAIAEQLAKPPRKAFVKLRVELGAYAATALFLSEAAMVILQRSEEIKKKHGAGFLTPSCLGDEYVDRVQKAGVKIEVKQIGDVGSK